MVAGIILPMAGSLSDRHRGGGHNGGRIDRQLPEMVGTRHLFDDVSGIFFNWQAA